jgi:hypothetical protein
MRIPSKGQDVAGRAGCAVLLASGVLLLLAAPVSASPTTIGQLAPGTSPPALCHLGPFDSLQPTVISGNSYVVPPGGAKVISWSTNAAAGAGQMMTLKVFRQVSGFTYKVIGHDGPRELTPGTVNTFQTNIPVEPGDVIGNNDENASEATPNACVFSAPGDSNLAAPTESDLVDGTAAEFNSIEPELRLNVAAVVTVFPGIASISPASGSIAGGTPVTITGHDFTAASAVNFGSVPAESFTVNSDTQITASAPPNAKPVAVDTSVTTAVGTSSASASDMFTYTACLVPNLKGKTLTAAGKKLKKADCKLGKAKGKKTKSAKVTKQSPKPGKVLAPGAKVNVELGG